jgi:hypothetical protein
MWQWLAFVRGRLHCWRWHSGGRAVMDTHYGRLEIFCPICGRLFWSDDGGE